MTDRDESEFAEVPRGVTLSHEKWVRLHAEAYGWRNGRADPRLERELREYEQGYVHGLRIGNLEAAVVIATQPAPLVAVYSVDFDNVVVLGFPTWIGREYSLRVGTKLATISTFAEEGEKPPATDTWFGGNASRNWVNFQPMIAHFVTDSAEEIQRCMSQLEDDEWQLAWELGLAYHRFNPKHIRRGEPMYSIRCAPARGLRTFDIPQREECKPLGWGPPMPQVPPATFQPRVVAPLVAPQRRSVAPPPHAPPQGQFSNQPGTDGPRMPRPRKRRLH